ncbi:MAG: hypothetical protein HUK14_10645 [Muribaculaceae bacterium]|nr:hypothetical protein [Muribaculaceae bacterium]
MKKLFTLFALAVVAMTAYAVPFKMTVDDASHVDYLEYNGNVYKFEDGNVLEFDATASATAVLYLADPWALDPASSYTYKSIYMDSPYEGTLYQDYKSAVNIYIYPESNEWYDYNIKTIDMSVLRNNSCEVYVHGDPSNVKISYSNTYNEPVLVEGKNVLKFMDSEAKMSINSVNYQDALYELYLNNVNIVNKDYSWYLDIKDGDVLDIFTEWPDKDFTVTINFSGDATAADFGTFQVNNQDVDASKPFVGKMGQYFSIWCNTSLFNFVSMTVNGEVPEGIYPSYVYYSGRLSEDLVIDINMTAKPKWNVNVTVDNYENIKYRFSNNYEEYFYPESNTFSVEVVENPMYSLDILARSGDSKVESVTANGETISENYRLPGVYSVWPSADNTEVNVTTSTITRDEAFVFYFDSPEKTQDPDKQLYGWYLNSKVSSRNQELVDNMRAGYNAIAMGPVDLPFTFAVNGPLEGAVDTYVFAYLNNVAYPLDLENYQTTWSLDLKNNDVFKVYIADEAPETYQVSFSVSDPSVVEFAVVDLCHEFAVDNDTNLVDQLPGTEIGLEVVEGAVVKVNDVVEEPVEDNVYLLTINSDMKVNITKESGIDSVTVSEDTEAPVYNLMGVKVSNGSTDALPAGIYVKKGIKVLVK